MGKNKKYDLFNDIVLFIGPLILLFGDLYLGLYNEVIISRGGSFSQNGLPTFFVILDYYIGQTGVRIILLAISVIFGIRLIYRMQKNKSNGDKNK